MAREKCKTGKSESASEVEKFCSAQGVCRGGRWGAGVQKSHCVGHVREEGRGGARIFWRGRNKQATRFALFAPLAFVTLSRAQTGVIDTTPFLSYPSQATIKRTYLVPRKAIGILEVRYLFTGTSLPYSLSVPLSLFQRRTSLSRHMRFLTKIAPRVSRAATVLYSNSPIRFHRYPLTHNTAPLPLRPKVTLQLTQIVHRHFISQPHLQDH